MSIEQNEIWLADLNPQLGTEAGKTRPVLVIQSKLLNTAKHPTTIICPISTKVRKNAEILRVHLPSGTGNLRKPCDVLIDQLRAVDNKRLIKKIGRLPEELVWKVKENIQIVLDIR